MSKQAKKLKEARDKDRRAYREEKRQARDARRVGGVVPPEEGTREVHVTILVVCEGEKTEPNYFRAFPITSGDVKVCGVGMNTLTLVEETVRLRDADGGYDETWAVFDRDSFPEEDFQSAFTLAGRQQIEVAYTNEAFELWYLLHFSYCDASQSRKIYGERLSDCLRRPYAKNDERMYYELLPRQPDAIRNACRLLAFHGDMGALVRRPNPSTTVQRLVQRLNELSRP